MGCSELINRQIVDSYGYGDYAQSCLRSSAGNSCGKCWKCFRKNTLIGKPFEMSNEIRTFLGREPLKMAASTLYSIQKLQQKNLADEILSEHLHILQLIGKDVSFLEGYYPKAIELIPEKYRELTKNLLMDCVPKMNNIKYFEKFEI